MKTLDDLLFEKEKLQELIRYAELFNGHINIGSELITLDKLKEMLNDVQIEIEMRRAQNNLTQIKFSKN